MRQSPLSIPLINLCHAKSNIWLLIIHTNRKIHLRAISLSRYTLTHTCTLQPQNPSPLHQSVLGLQRGKPKHACVTFLLRPAGASLIPDIINRQLLYYNQAEKETCAQQ